MRLYGVGGGGEGEREGQRGNRGGGVGLWWCFCVGVLGLDWLFFFVAIYGGRVLGGVAKGVFNVLLVLLFMH